MRTLALVLAAGKGTSIKDFLTDDEPVKAMIKVGDDRLIDLVLNSLEGIDAERAVLSFPAEEYAELDARVEGKNVRVLKQRARHIKLPYLSELPFILLVQYHISKDRAYLQSFDSIMTLPCDVVLENVNLEDMLRFHYKNLKDPEEGQVTILSKKGTGNGRAELFVMEGDRIIRRKPYRGQSVQGYEIYTQAGIYIFSRGILKHPYTVTPTLRHFKLLRYLTQGDWIDYGNPETLQRLRA